MRGSFRRSTRIRNASVGGILGVQALANLMPPASNRGSSATLVEYGSVYACLPCDISRSDRTFRPEERPPGPVQISPPLAGFRASPDPPAL
jgi:hypothetical protein